MGKVIQIIDPNRACGDIMHDAAWRCNDNTTSHMCQRDASHIMAKGDEKLHKCSLCLYMWPDGQKGKSKREATSIQTIRLCDQCRQPCTKDDFMGIPVWVCEDCQEIYDDESRRPKKEKGKMLCPIGAKVAKHEAEGKCSYGYCEDHCTEYHGYMPRHRDDKPGAGSTALVKVEEVKIPEPRPIEPIELFDRPTDVDWR